MTKEPCHIFSYSGYLPRQMITDAEKEDTEGKGKKGRDPRSFPSQSFLKYQGADEGECGQNVCISLGRKKLN